MVDIAKLKSTEPYLLEVPESLTPEFTKYNGQLWWWEDDGTCYVWTGNSEHWVQGYDGWYDRPVLNYSLDLNEAKTQFPGALPVRFMTTKKLETRRRKLRRERKIANTDVQVYQETQNLPAGFVFKDSDRLRTYSHDGEPEKHYFGWLCFTTGPRYVAAYWLPGQYQLNRVMHDSKSFTDKNEAQTWLLDKLSSLEGEREAQARESSLPEGS